jgi:hypothetical protein
MNKLELPELSPQAAPEFTDAATAKAWLENVPLANVATAQHQLLEQMQEFNRFAANAVSRLATLEALREGVHFVQIEQARRFTNRALPMAEAESAVFEDTLALWRQMHLGYLRCLAAAIAGEAGTQAQSALVCQRVLAYTGLKMFHHHRAYRQVPKHLWRELHDGYARAEALEVAEDPVKDYLNRDVTDTSPRIAYLRAVLLGMANPNELSQRQLTFLAFLLERWAEKVDVAREPPEEEVASLVADLEGDLCPERDGPQVAEPRYLDVKRLAKSLRNRIGLLRKGESPAKLALGEDCVQPSCEQLLVFLYRQWCRVKLRDPLLHLRPRVQAAGRCQGAQQRGARPDRRLRPRQHARGGQLRRGARLRARAVGDRGRKHAGTENDPPRREHRQALQPRHAGGREAEELEQLLARADALAGAERRR